MAQDQTLHPFMGLDIPHFIQAQAKRRPDHPFLIWEPFDGDTETWTYSRFADEVSRLAASLAARGVACGDRILIHLDNCPENLLAWYACAHLGAIAVTTNTRLVQEDLAYFHTRAAFAAAITEPGYAAILARACPDLGWMAIVSEDRNETADLCESSVESVAFSDLVMHQDRLALRAPDPMLPISIQFTSGTTSRPKGVVWTHANALWGAKMSALHETLTKDDVHLTFLPLFHTNAQSYSVLATLWVGGTVVLQPGFSASRFWPVALKHKCTWCSMVPFCVRALGRYPVPEHTFRYWGNAVAAPPWDEHYKVRTIGWWGMTETITQGILSDPRFGALSKSLGKPSIGYEIKILDDDERPVPAGQTGTLRIRGVRGVSLFQEYWKDEEATQQSFDEDGFFCTGDRVTVTKDGHLVFADRDKDMLKIGGENVGASEIERVIASVTGVQECAVVGAPDKMLDEVPVAFVIAEETYASSPENLESRIQAMCEKTLADFKRPTMIRFVKSLPRSTLNKVAKAQLREALRSAGQGAD